MLTPSGSSPRCRMPKLPTSWVRRWGRPCTGWPAASTTDRSPNGLRPNRSAPSPPSLPTSRRSNSSAGGPPSPSTPTGGSAGTVGRPHRHGQTQEIRHVDTDSIGDPALHHGRRRDPDGHGPPATTRPREIGPIRLVGVGFSGLSDVRQNRCSRARTAGGRTHR